MKKILGILVVFALSFLMSPQTNKVYAAACTGFNLVQGAGGPFNEGVATNNISLKLTNVTDGAFQFHFRGELDSAGIAIELINGTGSGGVVNFTSSNQNLFQAGSWVIRVAGPGISGFCELDTYEVSGPSCGYVYAGQIGRDDSTAAGVCFYSPEGGCLDSTHDIIITSSVYKGDGSPYTETVWQDLVPGGIGSVKSGASPNGFLLGNFGPLDPKNYQIEVQTTATGGVLCTYDFEVMGSCEGTGEDQCLESPVVDSGPDVFSLCDQIPETNADQRQKCIDCTLGGEDNLEGIWTAIGCIKKDPQVIIKKLITVGLGVGGGFTLITFLIAGFIFSTSQGSPERVKNAKEMMTSSIIGLLFVLFSVSLLQFVGWSILKIPGFGG